MRRELRAALAALPAAYFQDAGEAVAGHLAPMLREIAGTREGAAVAFFANLSTELDTAPLDSLLSELGLVRLLPAYATGSLRFHALDPGTRIPDLPKDRLGIPGPSPTSTVWRPENCALILAPGLAFDPSGGRLGRGGGYYDRALASLEGKRTCPLVIGLGLDLQMVPEVPMGPMDRRVDGVCTPSIGVFLRVR